MKTLFYYNKYLHPPSMPHQSSLEADWEKCNEIVPEKVIRKAIIYELYKSMQDELNLKDDGYFPDSN